MKHTNEENLQLITQMIKAAQRRFTDDSSLYLLWGFTVCIASLIQYALLRIDNAYYYIGWLVLIPIAVVSFLYLLAKQKKKEKVKTHIEGLLEYMWIAFCISMCIVLAFIWKLQENTYPVLLCLYAISTFICGGALRLKALIIGAVGCWVIAIISFFVNFELQSLLLSLAVIIAYIIPGFVIRKHNKRNQDV